MWKNCVINLQRKAAAASCVVKSRDAVGGDARYCAANGVTSGRSNNSKWRAFMENVSFKRDDPSVWRLGFHAAIGGEGIVARRLVLGIFKR